MTTTHPSFDTTSERKKVAILSELVHNFKDGKIGEQSPEEILKSVDDILDHIKNVIFIEVDGKDMTEVDEPPDRVAKIHAFATEFIARNIFPALLQVLRDLSFETRKNVGYIFTYFLKKDSQGFTSSYMWDNRSILDTLMSGYSDPKSALPCGAMLRECIKLPNLHQTLLAGPENDLSPAVQDLFEEHIRNPNFEVAVDAFETLSALLTNNKQLVFDFFNPEASDATLHHYNRLVHFFTDMLLSDNYVLQRQSLKLLSEFLLDRDNFKIMMKFISDKNNLKLIMNMLRQPQSNIQFEAFHVFKVFVANPIKPTEISEILLANKQKLVAFLRGFQNDKDDEQFKEEKDILIYTLECL